MTQYGNQGGAIIRFVFRVWATIYCSLTPRDPCFMRDFRVWAWPKPENPVVYCPSRVIILTLQSICNAGTFSDAYLLETHKEPSVIVRAGPCSARTITLI